MLPKEKDVDVTTETDTSVVENRGQAGSEEIMPAKKILTEEDFNDYFDKIPITSELQKDLYTYSCKAYIASMIRAILVFTIMGALLLLGITADTFDRQIPFIVLAGVFIIVVQQFDLLMSYSLNTVKWFKEQGIQTGYIAVVTGKHKTRKTMIVEINNESYIRIVDSSDYNSLSRNEAILIFVKNDDYRVVGTCSFLGISEPMHSMRDMFK